MQIVKNRNARAERFHDIEEAATLFEHATKTDAESIETDLILELDLTEQTISRQVRELLKEFLSHTCKQDS